MHPDILPIFFLGQFEKKNLASVANGPAICTTNITRKPRNDA